MDSHTTPTVSLTDEKVRACLEGSGGETPQRYEVQRLNSNKAELPDTTQKYLVREPSGETGFMLISGHGNPHLVARAVRNIGAVRERLPERLSETVLAPRHTGQIDGLSWAIWPRHEPLLSSNRWICRWRLLRHRRMLLGWAHDLCHASLSKPSDAALLLSGFEAPLSRVATDQSFPDRMRHQADAGISRLRAGTWKPFHCIQHGDLWVGNFLLPRARLQSVPLFVIDWAGAKVSGYPVFDAARLGMSLRCPLRSMAKYLQKWTGMLDCSESDLLAYALCAIGDLGRNLEHFPEDRYRAMAGGVMDYLDAAISR